MNKENIPKGNYTFRKQKRNDSGFSYMARVYFPDKQYVCDIEPKQDKEEANNLAEFIVEAFNVFSETNMTPNELFDELLSVKFDLASTQGEVMRNEEEIEQLQQQIESDKKTIEALKNDWREVRDENNLLQQQRDELENEIATKVLLCRDAFLQNDMNEVWHQLYSIASPYFDKTEPWEEFEKRVKANNNTK